MKSNSQSDYLGDQPMPGPFRLRPNMTKGPGDKVAEAQEMERKEFTGKIDQRNR